MSNCLKLYCHLLKCVTIVNRFSIINYFDTLNPAVQANEMRLTYKMRPSSPADQKTHGLSGTVAKRLTRCV